MGRACIYTMPGKKGAPRRIPGRQKAWALRESSFYDSAVRRAQCNIYCPAPFSRGKPAGRLILIKLQRTGVELIIGALEFDQVVMSAALDDVTVVEHHDGVGVLHR